MPWPKGKPRSAAKTKTTKSKPARAKTERKTMTRKKAPVRKKK